MANGGDVKVTMNRPAFDGIKSGIHSAIAQIFEADIKGDAQELSPVDTSRNKNSIDTETAELEDGSILAVIFTQSGYGGYLELGHRVRGDSGTMVEGRPYLYPAFMSSLPALLELCRNNIQHGVQTV